MNAPSKPELPIGYWLKRVDELLTEGINRAQAGHGITRSEWQVLNLLHEGGPARRETLFESLHTFFDLDTLDAILARMIERGWAQQGQPSGPGTAEFLLTPEGRHQHGRLFATQKEFRQRAMQGISPEDYARAVQVLQRIVANLEQG